MYVAIDEDVLFMSARLSALHIKLGAIFIKRIMIIRSLTYIWNRKYIVL
jgi:hypothetical protein